MVADAEGQSQRSEGAARPALKMEKETTSQETRWPLEVGQDQQAGPPLEFQRAQPYRHLDLGLVIPILDSCPSPHPEL